MSKVKDSDLLSLNIEGKGCVCTVSILLAGIFLPVHQNGSKEERRCCGGSLLWTKGARWF